MSYGVRMMEGGGGWEVFEDPYVTPGMGFPVPIGLTLSQAVARASLLAGWGRERLATDWISKWPDWSLPVLGTVGGSGRINP